MAEDYSRSVPLSEAVQMAYSHINEILIAEGYLLRNFPSMNQIIEITHHVTENNSVYVSDEIGQSQYSLLNTEQKRIVDII